MDWSVGWITLLRDPIGDETNIKYRHPFTLWSVHVHKLLNQTTPKMKLNRDETFILNAQFYSIIIS